MTKIEWVKGSDGSQGKTWNPLAGCTVLTPGCRKCYAMKMAARLEAMGQPLYAGLTERTKAGPVWTGVMRQASDDVLFAPLHRRKPTTFFVNSMSDLFHEAVPDEWIDRVFAVMALCPQHTFQVLTKRSQRMQQYCSNPDTRRRIYEFACEMVVEMELQVILIADRVTEPNAPNGPRIYLDLWPLPNVWLGVSTERQQEADERIPHLLQTPAAIRFISAEPLLGPIDLTSINHRGVAGGHSALTDRGLGKLDWVIVGGESGGVKSRPMHPNWVRALRDQCAGAGTPFFFKQWGHWVTEDQSPEDIVLPGSSRAPWAERDEDGHWFAGDQTHVYSVGKNDAGAFLDGVLHRAMPAGTAP